MYTKIGYLLDSITECWTLIQVNCFKVQKIIFNIPPPSIHFLIKSGLMEFSFFFSYWKKAKENFNFMLFPTNGSPYGLS